MAMTLRLSDAEAEALRRRAERESRSMQDVARQAVREYIENQSRAELLDQVLDEGLPQYAEALEQLRQRQIDHSFRGRSEEHTSELQSRGHLVCRLLLEKKNKR